MQQECIMNPIDYLKLQSKNLHRDFKTKRPNADPVDGFTYYDYSPKFFDVDAILISFDIDQDNFTLMNAQHIIANLVGFAKWADLINASEDALALSKLLFDNMHKVCIEEWQDYIARTEHENQMEFDDDVRLEIFQKVFAEVDGHESFKMDYRLAKTKALSDESPKRKPAKKQSAVKIMSLPLVGANRKKFIATANSVFDYVLDRLEPQHPNLVRELWNPEKYIDELLLKPDMLPIDRDYALSLIDAFLVHHVIELAVETDTQA